MAKSFAHGLGGRRREGLACNKPPFRTASPGSKADSLLDWGQRFSALCRAHGAIASWPARAELLRWLRARLPEKESAWSIPNGKPWMCPVLAESAT